MADAPKISAWRRASKKTKLLVLAFTSIMSLSSPFLASLIDRGLDRLEERRADSAYGADLVPDAPENQTQAPEITAPGVTEQQIERNLTNLERQKAHLEEMRAIMADPATSLQENIDAGRGYVSATVEIARLTREAELATTSDLPQNLRQRETDLAAAQARTSALLDELERLNQLEENGHPEVGSRIFIERRTALRREITVAERDESRAAQRAATDILSDELSLDGTMDRREISHRAEIAGRQAQIPILLRSQERLLSIPENERTNDENVWLRNLESHLETARAELRNANVFVAVQDALQSLEFGELNAELQNIKRDIIASEARIAELAQDFPNSRDQDSIARALIREQNSRTNALATFAHDSTVLELQQAGELYDSEINAHARLAASEARTAALIEQHISLTELDPDNPTIFNRLGRIPGEIQNSHWEGVNATRTIARYAAYGLDLPAESHGDYVRWAMDAAELDYLKSISEAAERMPSDLRAEVHGPNGELLNEQIDAVTERLSRTDASILNLSADNLEDLADAIGAKPSTRSALNAISAARAGDDTSNLPDFTAPGGRN